MKVRGKIAKSEAEDAIHQYITERYSRIISPMLQLRDKKGKKTYNEETALSAANAQLLKVYFSFK